MRPTLLVLAALCVCWGSYGQGVGGVEKPPPLSLDLRGMARATGIHALAFSPDAKTLATGAYEGEVALWDVVLGEKVAVFLAHDPATHRSSVLAVGFSAGGTRLAACFGSGKVVVWDTGTGEEILAFEVYASRYVLYPPPEETPPALGTPAVRAGVVVSGPFVTDAAFSPDLTLLATGSLDGRIRLWDVSSGDHVSTLESVGAALRPILFSPDGRAIAAWVGDEGIQLWDLMTGRPTVLVRGLTTPLAFSPGGDVLAVADGPRILLWNLSANELAGILVGHEGEVALASFSPHGGLLASASRDGEICLWDLAAGRRILEYWTATGGTPMALAFSRSGDLLGVGLSFLVPTEPAVLLVDVRGLPRPRWSAAGGG
ncbi:MAG TPA: WD40 repeat domain-containing protein [Candidatus Acetothermia bacterium]|nr:WD40 repeat domain-containing protein [Candidatus Acetothermia bacterium]